MYSGTNVSVIFVQPSQKLVWRASGESIPYSSIPMPLTPTWTAKDSDPILIALVNPSKNAYPSPTVRFRFPAGGQLSATFSAVCQGNRIWMCGYKSPTEQPAMQDISVGIADGPWNMGGWLEMKKQGDTVQAIADHGRRFDVTITGTTRKQSSKPVTIVEFPGISEFNNVATRLVVKTDTGVSMPYISSKPTPDNPNSTTYTFSGDITTVARVELQTCHFEWTTLPAVHFRPNQ